MRLIELEDVDCAMAYPDTRRSRPIVRSLREQDSSKCRIGNAFE